MFLPEQNLGVSDYAVSRAIPELHEHLEFIKPEDVARHINGSRSTVYRAIDNLKAAGILVCVETRRGQGARYHIKS